MSNVEFANIHNFLGMADKFELYICWVVFGHSFTIILDILSHGWVMFIHWVQNSYCDKMDNVSVNGCVRSPIQMDRLSSQFELGIQGLYRSQLINDAIVVKSLSEAQVNWLWLINILNCN